jgi:hypothetical protein
VFEGVDKETMSKERKLVELEGEKRDHEENMKKVEDRSSKNAAKIGQASAESDKNSKQVEERDRLVQNASRNLGIDHEDGNMLTAIQTESQKLKREMKIVMSEQRNREDLKQGYANVC